MGDDDDDALWAGEEIYYREDKPSMISKQGFGPFSVSKGVQARQSCVDPRLAMSIVLDA